MKKITLCFRRCIPPLAGAALMLTSGCDTHQDTVAAAGNGAPSARSAPTPYPDHTGPHPVYIINDSGSPVANVNPGLIVDLPASPSQPVDDSGLTDVYEVPALAAGQPPQVAPQPVIEINLPPERPRTGAGTGPRTVVVVMGDASTITHKKDRRTIVVHLPLNIQYNAAAAPRVTPPPPTTTVSTTYRHRSGG